MNPNSFISLRPKWIQYNSSAVGNATGMILDASGEKLAFKYYPSTTSPITDVDFNLTLVGTSPTFKVGIFADSANAPDDATQLGGYTPNWTLAASGWLGIKTLAANTGNLTINTPVWIVIEYVSGTINGSNSIQSRVMNNVSTGQGLNRIMLRHHNGTNWTTTTAQVVLGLVVVKHADGSYGGFGLTTGRARTAQADIFVNAGTTQVQGVKFKCGAQVKIVGVEYVLTKSGSPADLKWSVYEGDTEKYTATELAANVISDTPSECYFASPILLAANTDLFIIASQAGTSGTDDYDLYVAVFESTYIETAAASASRLVYGNGFVPSALSVSTTEIPYVVPIIGDPAVDFGSGGSGGGCIIGGR